MKPDNFNRLKWNIVSKCLPDIGNGDFGVLAVYWEKTHRSIHRYRLCMASDIIEFQGSFIVWMPLPALPKEAE